MDMNSRLTLIYKKSYWTSDPTIVVDKIGISCHVHHLKYKIKFIKLYRELNKNIVKFS